MNHVPRLLLRVFGEPRPADQLWRDDPPDDDAVEAGHDEPARG